MASAGLGSGQSSPWKGMPRPYRRAVGMGVNRGRTGGHGGPPLRFGCYEPTQRSIMATQMPMTTGIIQEVKNLVMFLVSIGQTGKREVAL